MPVIPVAHEGTHHILTYENKKPGLFPRTTVRAVAERRVDLSQWAGQARTLIAADARRSPFTGTGRGSLCSVRVRRGRPVTGWGFT